MNEELKPKEEKKLKTWDEAINELQAFIIKSKQEEREKAQKEQKQEN